MTKTALEVTAEALQMIGVLAQDEEPSAEDHARAKAHLEAIFAELDETFGIAPEWTIETVPDKLWLPVSKAVAGSICTGYSKPEFTGLRAVGMAGIMRAEFGGQPRRATEAQFF